MGEFVFLDDCHSIHRLSAACRFCLLRTVRLPRRVSIQPLYPGYIAKRIRVERKVNSHAFHLEKIDGHSHIGKYVALAGPCGCGLLIRYR